MRLDSSRRAYAALLEREIERIAGLIGRRAKVSHVHWGGGTPTSLPGDRLMAIMARLRQSFAFEPDAEIAIELDPTSLPKDRLEALSGMGVTRVSLGVQDLDPAVQEAIGRRNPTRRLRDCADKARGLSVGSLNLDLIYGLPLQTEASVARTARRALDLAADRVAVFGYAHVPWMKKHQQLIAEDSLPAPPCASPSSAQSTTCSSRRAAMSRSGSTVTPPRRRDGVGEGLAPPPARLPGLHHRRRAGADRLRRQRDRLAARGLRPKRADRAGLGQAGRGGRVGHCARRRASAEDRLRRDAIERLMCDLEADLLGIAEAHAADPAPLLACLTGLSRFEADGLAHWDGRRAAVSEKGRPFVRSVAALFDAYLVQDTDTPRHSRAV